jgi:hypothetical protein
MHAMAGALTADTSQSYQRRTVITTAVSVSYKLYSYDPGGITAFKSSARAILPFLIGKASM